MAKDFDVHQAGAASEAERRLGVVETMRGVASALHKVCTKRRMMRDLLSNISVVF